jgi:hypothetical protein
MNFLLAMMLQLAVAIPELTIDTFSDIDEPTSDPISVSITVQFEGKSEQMSEVVVADGFSTLELDYDVEGIGIVHNSTTDRGIVFIRLVVYPDDLREGDEDVNVVFALGDTLYRHRLVINDND